MSKNTEGKSFTRIMRSLHRDIGFLLIGLTLIYCLSGIVLIYRDQGILKSEQRVEKTIAPGLSAKDLETALHLRKMKVSGQEGDVIYFNYGKYNISTGYTSYKTQKYPLVIEKLNSLHMSPSNSVIHVAGVVYGILLIFLAVSSLLMYRPGTRLFNRGVLFSGGGITMAIVLLTCLG